MTREEVAEKSLPSVAAIWTKQWTVNVRWVVAAIDWPHAPSLLIERESR